MSGFPILDLVIGMIFIFFLLSVISSSVVELIMTILRVRSRLMEKWLIGLFDKNVPGPDGTQIKLGQAIMDHSSVKALSKAGQATSYIDAKNFTSALLEKLTFDPAKPDNIAKNIDDFVNAINASSALPVELKRTFLTYANDAKEDFKVITQKTSSEIELFRKKIENWYDSSMQRVTGTLKKKAAIPFTIIIAVFVTICLNANSVAIASYLYSNKAAAAKLADNAMKTVQSDTVKKMVNAMKQPSSDTAKSNKNTAAASGSGIDTAFIIVNNNIANLKDQGLPLGWDPNKNWLEQFKESFWSNIVGWLGTIFAIIMGAPFWFDLLNKIANLRGNGAKPATAAATDNAADGNK